MANPKNKSIFGLIGALFLLAASPARAEDDKWLRYGKVNRAVVPTVAVSNVKVSARDARSALITFDIAWENSWRTSVNHDAAWVFFKVLPKGAAAWEHVAISGANPPADGPANAATQGTEVDLLVPPDHMGLFVRRAKEGSGRLSTQNIKVVWALAHGPIKPDSVRILAQAVEMVYVPEGTNTVGSGGHDYSDFHEGGSGNAPFAIKSEAALTLAETKGCLSYQKTAAHPGDGTGVLSAEFPKGFAAFYCMKFEVTEGDWVDFFNTLDDAQKKNRDITSGLNGGKNTDEPTIMGNNARTWWWIVRNTVSWTTGDATTQERDLPCSYLSWADGAAWGDWAGLRPMTELEYEKGRRAPQGAAPMWGIMHLDSSLNDRIVTVGNEQGRAFTGLDGDGKLDANGDADVPNWPGADSRGSGIRGGCGPNFNPHSGASDRAYAVTDKTQRQSSFGWRAVRSAPAPAPAPGGAAEPK
ncbi:MAG: SUMF1/EgtB/PvdO family nonheme iron enzyme [Planctomycetota bacterium]|nr:SUMF1/EgtB/PvdO family nonheme iron enzyme [Planctomycetota bacterium]